jgi:hypothetical protein
LSRTALHTARGRVEVLLVRARDARPGRLAPGMSKTTAKQLTAPLVEVLPRIEPFHLKPPVVPRPTHPCPLGCVKIRWTRRAHGWKCWTCRTMVYDSELDGKLARPQYQRPPAPAAPARTSTGQFVKGQSANPGGIPKVKGKNLAELIQSEVDPRRILKLLNKYASRGDRFSLELLATHLAGQPPRNPPQVELPQGAADLTKLTVDQLRTLEALMSAAEGNPEPLHSLEQRQRDAADQKFISEVTQ